MKDAEGNIIAGKNSGNPNEAQKNGELARTIRERMGEKFMAAKNYDYKGAIDNVKNYDYKKAAEDTKQKMVNYDYKKAAEETKQKMTSYDYKGAMENVKNYDYKGTYDNAANSEQTKKVVDMFGSFKTTIQQKIQEQKDRQQAVGQADQQ